MSNSDSKKAPFLGIGRIDLKTKKMSGQEYDTVEQLLADLVNNDPPSNLRRYLQTRIMCAIPEISKDCKAATDKLKNKRKTSIYELFGSDSEDDVVKNNDHDRVSGTGRGHADHNSSVSSFTSAEETENDINVHSSVRVQPSQHSLLQSCSQNHHVRRRDNSNNEPASDASETEDEDEDRNTADSESSTDADPTMTNTYKRKIFPTEPMNDKPVTEIAGIGKVIGDKLAKNGFPMAKDVFNKLTLLDFDAELYETWLRDEYHVTLKNAKNSYECLCDWYHQFPDLEENAANNAANNGENPRRNLRRRASRRMSAAAAPKRRMESNNTNSLNGEVLQESEKSDETMSFYITMARKALKLPILLRKQVEMNVYTVISNAELQRATEQPAAPAPSTSRDTFEPPAPPGPAKE